MKLLLHITSRWWCSRT